MAQRLRTTLPTDFASLLLSSDLDELTSLFAGMTIDARTRGFPHQTALAFAECPDDLTRWLVAHGLDVDAPDDAGYSPLYARAGSTYRKDHKPHYANIEVLLDLGAKVDGTGKETPLLHAISGGVLEHVRLLVERGANLEARDLFGHNAMEIAVWRCDDVRQARDPLQIVEYLATLKAPATGLRRWVGSPRPAFTTTDEIRKAVRRFGHDWQLDNARARAKYGQTAYQDAGSEQIRRLCELFDVTLPPPVDVHDGSSPITVTSSDWKTQHAQLWDLLVPSGGPARTVQGEVIRISGRVAHEILDNGGGNWDAQYRAMLDSFPGYVHRGVCLDDAGIGDCVKALRGGQFDEAAITRLSQYAVRWVLLNPTPIPLEAPSYRR